MSTTQHTGHYNLPTFGDNPNDRPSWRGDFTDAMTKIDNQMYANATNITTATAAANNATTAAGEAKKAAEAATSLAQANKNDIADLDGYFGKLGVTSESTAQQLMDTINGKAEDTELTSLKSSVSSLSSTVNTKANTSDVYTKGQADTTFTKQGGYSGTAQQLNQRIQALETTPQDQLPICLCIGDSYANSSSTVNADSTDATKWPTQLRNVIGGEYQVKTIPRPAPDSTFLVIRSPIRLTTHTALRPSTTIMWQSSSLEAVETISVPHRRWSHMRTRRFPMHASSSLKPVSSPCLCSGIMQVWTCTDGRKPRESRRLLPKTARRTLIGLGRGTSATIPIFPAATSTRTRMARRLSRPIWPPQSEAPIPDATKRPPSLHPAATCIAISWRLVAWFSPRFGAKMEPQMPN